MKNRNFLTILDIKKMIEIFFVFYVFNFVFKLNCHLLGGRFIFKGSYAELDSKFTPPIKKNSAAVDIFFVRYY